MARTVAVLGLGYVGLPLIRACIAHGDTVLGYDIDTAKVEGLKAGRSHVDDVTDDEVQQWTSSGFTPTSDPESLNGVDVFVICVPTPLTSAGGPDLGAVEGATWVIAEALPHANPRPTVILESTTYPGTTEEVVKPILEKSGLIAGEDFHLAFSPERIDPGNKQFTFENTPKIVGGLTEGCADAAEAFYGPLTVRVVRVKGLKEAEMAKLLENTYRHVNIALVNELAKLSHAMGIDIWDVIAAAETKPYGFQAFRPGPGVGGHCIPIDPNYLSHRVKAQLGQPFRFVELAQEINASMPAYVAQRAQNLLNDHGIAIHGSKVLILGITYKPNIADQRESPAVQVVRELKAKGAHVTYHDPHVEVWYVDGSEVERTEDLSGAASAADCTILLQGHDQYRDQIGDLDEARLLDTQSALHDGSHQGERLWTTL